MGWPWSMLTAQVITLGAKVILSASNHAVIATAVHYVLKQLVLVQLDVQLVGLAITVTKQYVKPIHADGTVNALHPIYVDAPKNIQDCSHMIATERLPRLLANISHGVDLLRVSSRPLSFLASYYSFSIFFTKESM